MKVFNFINHADSSCKNISFLKLEIEEIPKDYNGVLKDYFFDLGLKKNNLTVYKKTKTLLFNR